MVAVNRRNINILVEQRRARQALEAALERLQRMQRRFGKTEVPWVQVNVTIRGGTFPMDGTGLFDVVHPAKATDRLSTTTDGAT